MSSRPNQGSGKRLPTARPTRPFARWATRAIRPRAAIRCSRHTLTGGPRHAMSRRYVWRVGMGMHDSTSNLRSIALAFHLSLHPSTGPWPPPPPPPQSQVTHRPISITPRPLTIHRPRTHGPTAPRTHGPTDPPRCTRSPRGAPS